MQKYSCMNKAFYESKKKNEMCFKLIFIHFDILFSCNYKNYFRIMWLKDKIWRLLLKKTLFYLLVEF